LLLHPGKAADKLGFSIALLRTFSIMVAMKKILILLVRFYRLAISPFLGNNCRFSPTCSEYAMQALDRYGALKGLYLAGKRILKCHPFHRGGYDPLK